MTDFRTKAEEVVQPLPDDVDWTVDEVEQALRELVNDYQVPIDEAVSSTISKIQDEYDGEIDMGEQTTQQDEDLDIGVLGVEHDEQWFNIRGQVERLFDLSEKQDQYFAQRGVIADNTGETIFTVPNEAVEEDASLELEEGQAYEIEGAVGDAYQGNSGIKLVSTTSATAIDEEFTPPDSDTTIVGSLIDVQDKSGLVKRCPQDDCNRVLNQGRCPDHGDVDGDFDLRLKTVIDDGQTAEQVYFGQEATAALTSIDLEQAREIAEESMDHTAVIREMEPLILNRYYRVQGDEVGEYVIVNGFERVNRETDERAEKAREAIADTREVMA